MCQGWGQFFREKASSHYLCSECRQMYFYLFWWPFLIPIFQHRKRLEVGTLVSKKDPTRTKRGEGAYRNMKSWFNQISFLRNLTLMMSTWGLRKLNVHDMRESMKHLRPSENQLVDREEVAQIPGEVGQLKARKQHMQKLDPLRPHGLNWERACALQQDTRPCMAGNTSAV